MNLECKKMQVKYFNLLRDYIDHLSSLEDLNEQQQQDLNDLLFTYEAELSIVKNSKDERIKEHVRRCYKEVSIPVRNKLDGLKMTSKILKKL